MDVRLTTKVQKYAERLLAEAGFPDVEIHLNAWNTDAVKKLGVSDLQIYVLADKKGKIVARGNTVDDMKKDVEANVKKNKKAEKDESDEDESEADEA